MSIFKRSTGNWAEDMGNSIHALLVWGLICAFLVPVLVAAVVVLVVIR